MDKVKKASIAVGAVAGLGIITVFSAPLWAGILAGVGGALVAPKAIDFLAKREV